MSLETKVPPPVVAAAAALIIWGISQLTPQIEIPSSVRFVASLTLVVGGVTLAVAGFLSFRRARTTVHPTRPEEASSLVTTGVYRFTRNPMYLGLGLLLTAWAVWLSALLPFAGPVLYVLYMTRFQIQPEERVLGGIFGEAYSAYTGRVRRWL